MRHALAALLLAGAPVAAQTDALSGYGPRPAYLVGQMEGGPLKDRLMSCLGRTPERTDFSIAHRGAPLMFPEHSVGSNVAAAGMGAGLLECDVTFTKDHALVCRHAQDDLAQTTDILTTPLATTCVEPFVPAADGRPASATCRTSEITLEEFRTLRPRMESFDRAATTPEAAQGGVPPWRTTLYADDARLLTLAESIALFEALGARHVPELKEPAVDMPHDGLTREVYAQALIDAYRAAGVPPEDVRPQSFALSDVLYWIREEPAFGARAIYLDDRYAQADAGEGRIDPMDVETFVPSMRALADMGVRTVAPPLWMLVTARDGRIVPSVYAEEARAAGLGIVAWTMERSGRLAGGGGWYHQSVADLIDDDGDAYVLLDVLARDVGVEGVFSDWPATVTFYANCMGL